MKKNLFSKILVASSLMGLVSCGGDSTSPVTSPVSSTTPLTTPAQTTTAKGAFKYESHGHTYGMAVVVTFDAAHKITKVERDAATIEAESLVEVTQTTVEGVWNHEEMTEMYNSKIGEALNSFVGLEAEAYYNAAVAELNGKLPTTWPEKSGSFGAYLNLEVLTGATQSATRLAAAVANACATHLGKTVLVEPVTSTGGGSGGSTSTSPVTSSTPSSSEVSSSSPSSSEVSSSTPESSTSSTTTETPAA